MIYVIIVVVNLIICFFVTSFVCFYAGLHGIKNNEKAEFYFPDTEQYTPYKEEINKRINHNKNLPFKEIIIKSFDNLPLYARYYEAKEKNAPLILFFHGYRSSPFRDSAGVFDFYNKQGYSLLLITQRAHENSGGRFLTMGIKESKDCLSWINYAEENLKDSEKIILCGVSMGGATVLMTAGENLPERVKGVISDSAFSSVKEIMYKVIGEMKLNRKIAYFFIKTGALLYARVNLDEKNVKDQLKKAKIPIFFIHSRADEFVPFEMTKVCFDSYENQKESFFVDDAGHGMSYFSDKEGLMTALSNFIKNV